MDNQLKKSKFILLKKIIGKGPVGLHQTTQF